MVLKIRNVPKKAYEVISIEEGEKDANEGLLLQSDDDLKKVKWPQKQGIGMDFLCKAFVKYFLQRHLYANLSDFDDAKCILLPFSLAFEWFLNQKNPITIDKIGGIKLMRWQPFVKKSAPNIFFMIENRGPEKHTICYDVQY